MSEIPPQVPWKPLFRDGKPVFMDDGTSVFVVKPSSCVCCTDSAPCSPCVCACDLRVTICDNVVVDVIYTGDDISNYTWFGMNADGDQVKITFVPNGECSGQLILLYWNSTGGPGSYPHLRFDGVGDCPETATWTWVQSGSKFPGCTECASFNYGSDDGGYCCPEDGDVVVGHQLITTKQWCNNNGACDNGTLIYISQKERMTTNTWNALTENWDSFSWVSETTTDYPSHNPDWIYCPKAVYDTYTEYNGTGTVSRSSIDAQGHWSQSVKGPGGVNAVVIADEDPQTENNPCYTSTTLGDCMGSEATTWNYYPGEPCSPCHDFGDGFDDPPGTCTCGPDGGNLTTYGTNKTQYHQVDDTISMDFLKFDPDARVTVEAI